MRPKTVPNTHNSVFQHFFPRLYFWKIAYSEEVDETAKMGTPVQCIKSACCTGRRTEMPILLLLPIGGWSLENKLEVLNKSYHERNTRIRRSRGSAVPQDFPLDDLEIGN